MWVWVGGGGWGWVCGCKLCFFVVVKLSYMNGGKNGVVIVFFAGYSSQFYR